MGDIIAVICIPFTYSINSPGQFVIILIGRTRQLWSAVYVVKAK